MAMRIRTLHVVTILALIAALLLPLVAAVSVVGAQDDETPAATRERNRAQDEAAAPARPQRFPAAIQVNGEPFVFERVDPEAPTDLIELGQQGDLTLLAEVAQPPFDRVYVSAQIRPEPLGRYVPEGSDVAAEETATAGGEEPEIAPGEGSPAGPPVEPDAETPATDPIATEADEPEATVASDATEDPEATATSGGEAGDLAREVSLEDAGFSLDRSVPVDTEALTDVGTDGELTLLAEEEVGPFDRVYGVPGGTGDRAGRYLAQLPLDQDGTPSADASCLAESGNFAPLLLGEAEYAYAGLEPDLSTADLETVTQTGDGQPIYAETTEQPFTELFFGTDGALNRFVLLSDEGVPTNLGQTIGFGGQSFSFEANVTGEVDPASLARAGCVGPFPASADQGVPAGALDRLYVILNDQPQRVLAFAATGTPPAGTGTPGTDDGTVTADEAETPPSIPAPSTETAIPTETATAAPTETAIPATETPLPPTETPLPTETPVPPTETAVPTPAPTSTPIPTETPVPATETPVPPTETPEPTDVPEPTETAVPATETAVPATAVPTETPTPTSEPDEPVDANAATPPADDTPAATEAAADPAATATTAPTPATDAPVSPTALPTVAPPEAPVSSIPVDAPAPIPADFPREIEVQGIRYLFDLQVDLDLQSLVQVDTIQTSAASLGIFASQDPVTSAGRLAYLAQAPRGPFVQVYAVASAGVVARYVPEAPITPAGTIDLSLPCSAEASGQSFAYTFEGEEFRYAYASTEINISVETLRTATTTTLGQVPTVEGGRELFVRGGAAGFAEVFLSDGSEVQRFTALNAVGFPSTLNNLVFAETRFEYRSEVSVSVSQAGLQRVGCAGAFPIFAPPPQAAAQAPLATCYTVIDNRVYEFNATTIVQAPVSVNSFTTVNNVTNITVNVVPPPPGVVQIVLQAPTTQPPPTPLPNVRVQPLPPQRGQSPTPTPATGVVAQVPVLPRQCQGDPGQIGDDGVPERLPARIQLSGIAYGFVGAEEAGGDVRLTRIGCVGPFEANQAEGIDLRQVIFLRDSRASETLYRFEASSSFEVQFTVTGDPQVIVTGDQTYVREATWQRSVYSSYTNILYAEDPQSLDPPRLFGVKVDGDVIAEYVPEGGDVVEAAEELRQAAETEGINPDLVLGGGRRYLLVNLWRPTGTTTNGWVTLYSFVAEGVADTLLATDPRSLDLFIYRRSGA